jgi:hypothetical protein
MKKGWHEMEQKQRSSLWHSGAIIVIAFTSFWQSTEIRRLQESLTVTNNALISVQDILILVLKKENARRLP